MGRRYGLNSKHFHQIGKKRVCAERGRKSKDVLKIIKKNWIFFNTFLDMSSTT